MEKFSKLVIEMMSADVVGSSAPVAGSDYGISYAAGDSRIPVGRAPVNAALKKGKKKKRIIRTGELMPLQRRKLAESKKYPNDYKIWVIYKNSGDKLYNPSGNKIYKGIVKAFSRTQAIEWAYRKWSLNPKYHAVEADITNVPALAKSGQFAKDWD